MPADVIVAAVCIPVLAVASFLEEMPIVQYGALGILGFIVFWTLVKIFPALLKTVREDRAAFLREMERMRDRQQVIQDTFINQIDIQRRHDTSMHSATHLMLKEIRQRLTTEEEKQERA